MNFPLKFLLICSLLILCSELFWKGWMCSKQSFLLWFHFLDIGAGHLTPGFKQHLIFWALSQISSRMHHNIKPNVDPEGPLNIMHHTFPCSCWGAPNEMKNKSLADQRPELLVLGWGEKSFVAMNFAQNLGEKSFVTMNFARGEIGQSRASG